MRVALRCVASHCVALCVRLAAARSDQCKASVYLARNLRLFSICRLLLRVCVSGLCAEELRPLGQLAAASSSSSLERKAQLVFLLRPPPTRFVQSGRRAECTLREGGASRRRRKSMIVRLKVRAANCKNAIGRSRTNPPRRLSSRLKGACNG